MQVTRLNDPISSSTSSQEVQFNVPSSPIGSKRSLDSIDPLFKATANFMNPAEPSESVQLLKKACIEIPIVSTDGATAADPRGPDPRLMPAPVAYDSPTKLIDKMALTTPEAKPAATSAPKLMYKPRKLPTYMTMPAPTARVYGFTRTVLQHIQELCDIRELMYEDEKGNYRYYLDTDIDSITSAAEDSIISSKEQLVEIYNQIRHVSKEICEKIDKLMKESSVCLVEMPVCRLAWSGYAKEEALALVLAIDEELELLLDEPSGSE